MQAMPCSTASLKSSMLRQDLIALGVGIGVDYALYVLSGTLTRTREGASLAWAYAHALRFTGRVAAT